MLNFTLVLEHTGHVGTMSVSGYSNRRFKSRLHQYVVSLSKTRNPHCFSRLCCEVSTTREYHREGCLLNAELSGGNSTCKINTFFSFATNAAVD